MKSTKASKQSFTMEDLEKGLMLAGYITPSSPGELGERNAVEEYEKELSKNKQNVFFKRITLAAEIVFHLYEEPTFGRIKFQKLMYLCEHVADMDLNHRYVKQAAGPFDNKFMHSIEEQFKKNNWFEVEKLNEGNIIRSIYKPLDKVDNFKKYYNAYFRASNDNIQFVIELFRKKKTDTTEIAATIYACLIELDEKNEPISEPNVLEKFYNWSDKKKRFKKEQILETWGWLEENDLIPKK